MVWYHEVTWVTMWTYVHQNIRQKISLRFLHEFKVLVVHNYFHSPDDLIVSNWILHKTPVHYSTTFTWTSRSNQRCWGNMCSSFSNSWMQLVIRQVPTVKSPGTRSQGLDIELLQIKSWWYFHRQSGYCSKFVCRPMSKSTDLFLQILHWA